MTLSLLHPHQQGAYLPLILLGRMTPYSNTQASRCLHLVRSLRCGDQVLAHWPLIPSQARCPLHHPIVQHDPPLGPQAVGHRGGIGHVVDYSGTDNRVELREAAQECGHCLATVFHGFVARASLGAQRPRVYSMSLAQVRENHLSLESLLDLSKGLDRPTIHQSSCKRGSGTGACHQDGALVLRHQRMQRNREACVNRNDTALQRMPKLDGPGPEQLVVGLEKKDLLPLLNRKLPCHATVGFHYLGIVTIESVCKQCLALGLLVEALRRGEARVEILSGLAQVIVGETQACFGSQHIHPACSGGILVDFLVVYLRSLQEQLLVQRLR
mmetsp:Transcript_90480/g.207081  ORF Transcript_90480/g.207081 Transcript_90480/m.207081 type:complete len:327 (+) Transcript_90480:448-1428(+)